MKYFLLPVAILYLFAINSYLTPDTYDNVIYYEGARSLAEGKGYTINGVSIAVWPPGYSMILSIPMLAGFTQVIVSKLVTILIALFALIWLAKLFKEEKRPLANLSLFLFAISPYALQSATRVMSEFPFLFWSAGALYFFQKAKNENRFSHVILTGFSIAMALITRKAGAVLLLTLWMLTFCFKIKDLKRVGIVSVIGLFPFLLFFLYETFFTTENVSPDYAIEKIKWNFEPYPIFTLISDFILSTRFLPMTLLWILLSVIVIGFGCYKRVKKTGINASDLFLIFYFLLIIFFPSKCPRYILPIAPFLINDFVYGIDQALPKKLSSLIVVLLAVGYLAYDLTYLFRGQMKTYGPALSSTAEDYYKNQWLDLYRISKEVNSPVYVDPAMGGKWKYVYHWSRQPVVSKKHATLLLLEAQSENALISRQGSFHLYQNTPTPR